MSCYRHRDRVAGRRCTRCGKPACGECLVQANVGSHCLECAKASRPDLRTRARFWSAGKPALVAYTLIAVNIAVFVLLGAAYDLGGMLSGRITDAHLQFGLNSLFVDGNPVPYRLSTDEVVISGGTDYYRLVTSGFLHFGLIHIGMNMFFLYLLGNEMEPILGRLKFALVYGASLLGGSAGVILIDQGSITAGASGAVFGLLGAYAVGIWRHGVNVFSTQIGSLLMINLFLTFFVANISIGGHIGGLVAGGICGFVVLAPGYKGVPNWAKYATPCIVAVAALAVALVAA
ncbi:MAG: rhomboid family intramembrane serine protease [Ilumatobacter sp.]|uniref:rhomboid family intramembrane serine protease n=1 Tax=Ilumatobacter sp. TaxID=1967498 RepID=UPI00391A4C2F